MKPRDNSCIFCAIVAGHVPCHAVYEDAHLLAFLDHRPLNPGHVLIVPKRHEPDFYRLASALYGALMHLAHRLGKCLAHLYQPPKVGLFVIGFHVPHVHVHVVPLYAMAAFNVWVQWHGFQPYASGFVPLSMAEFSL